MPSAKHIKHAPTLSMFPLAFITSSIFCHTIEYKGIGEEVNGTVPSEAVQDWWNIVLVQNSGGGTRYPSVPWNSHSHIVVQK